MKSRSVWGVSLTVVLAAMNAVAAPAGGDVMLEVELNPAQVYVQSQAIYRMRFFQAVDVRDLKIFGPSARLAEVRPIGTDTVNETQRDGRRYRVHERRFAVFPFGSGALELTGARVEGRVAAIDATSTDGRQALRLDAPVQTLSVRPVPTEVGTNPWLPARSLTLSESWSPADLQTQTGQVLRRQIRIEALGVDAAQIPPVALVVPGMLIRAEAVKLENRTVGDVNLGVRDQTFSLVALNDGEIVVPQVRMPWWNLKNDSLTISTLTSRTLRVLPGDEKAEPILTAPSSLVPEKTPPQPSKTIATPVSDLSLWLSALAILCAGTLLAWLKRHTLKAEWALQHACRSASSSAVRHALLQWAAVIWPATPPTTLEALAQRLNDPQASTALAGIDRCLYGPTQGVCAAAALAAAVRTVKQSRRRAFLTQI